MIIQLEYDDDDDYEIDDEDKEIKECDDESQTYTLMHSSSLDKRPISKVKSSISKVM